MATVNRSTIECSQQVVDVEGEIARLMRDAQEHAQRGCEFEARRLRRIAFGMRVGSSPALSQR